MDSIYEVRAISGKGIGMVASKDVKPGQVIVEETPLITLSLSNDGDLVGKIIVRSNIKLKFQAWFKDKINIFKMKWKISSCSIENHFR